MAKLSGIVIVAMAQQLRIEPTKLLRRYHENYNIIMMMME